MSDLFGDLFCGGKFKIKANTNIIKWPTIKQNPLTNPFYTYSNCIALKQELPTYCFEFMAKLMRITESKSVDIEGHNNPWNTVVR